MRHFMYPAILSGCVFILSCSGHKSKADMSPVEGQDKPVVVNIDSVALRKKEIGEYRAKMDVLLDTLEARINENKKLRLLEKDKHKKEAYSATIDYLEKLKRDLKEKKKEFDERSNKAWWKFKEELNYIFSRNPSDDRNDPYRSSSKINRE